MSHTGPIIIIEADKDDQELTRGALQEVGVENPVQFLDNAVQALEYLQKTQEKPFLILSEVYLPKMNGLELQTRIHDDERLRKKSIPFLFFSSIEDPALIDQAYLKTIQGYFRKPNKFTELVETLEYIVGYWKRCVHPNPE